MKSHVFNNLWLIFIDNLSGEARNRGAGEPGYPSMLSAGTDRCRALYLYYRPTQAFHLKSCS